MKIVFAIVVLVAGSTAVFAEGHKGNSSAAKAMVEQIQALGGNIAPTVSGQNAADGDSGWGNAGSRATTGTQVSKSGKK